MEILRLPTVIDIRILGKCDLRCPFCFGPRHEMEHAPVDSLIAVIERLPRFGVQSIVLTGGEPTLVTELPRILVTAREVGLKTVLSTNGLLFRRRIAEIAPFIDWVGLPLDGATAESNAQLRVGSKDQFHTVLELIPLIRQAYPQLKIKLGTVVCALNKGDITNIARLVCRDCRPDIWKLYQVTQSSYGADNWHRLALDDSEFEIIVSQAQIVAKEFGIQLVVYRRCERDGKYLFLEPNGDALVVASDREVIIGNFFGDLAEVAISWQRYVNTGRLTANYTTTYPL